MLNFYGQPGGAAILRQYAAHGREQHDASWAFNGGLNNHSRAAKRKMVELRIARVLV
jgi:stearoyl-CoA desaturase (Delta-9 desaturase)